MARVTPQATVYDMLEKAGHFRHNTANMDSVDDQGYPAYKKQEFPMMLYHPDGVQRETQRPEIIATPLGPREVGQKFELISRIVNSPEERDALIAQGWKVRPAASILGDAAPPEPLTAEDQLAQMKAEVERLKRDLEMAQAGKEEED